MTQKFTKNISYMIHFPATSFIAMCTADYGIVITRNSSGDEIANVNFLYDDIVHALKIP